MRTLPSPSPRCESTKVRKCESALKRGCDYPRTLALSHFRTLGGVAVAVGLSACSGPQHMLDAQGPAAERVAGLWWVMFSVALAVVVLVAVLTVLAVLRGRRRAAVAAGGGAEPALMNGRLLVWSLGVVLPLVVVFYLVVESARVGVAAYRPDGADPNSLVVEVVGHQFWWEVRYPQLGITTANEIYMPAGEQVLFRVSSPDVIHSFWVPQLQGKIDMIPGRVNSLWMQADAPGLFRGACTEYCGPGHALMAFWVEAMPRAEFDAWAAHRRAPWAEPADEQVRFGREVFFEAQCHLCHSVPGHPLPRALGEVGPDLSDYGRRRTIAAGTRPNNPGTLGAWLADPEGMKPGARMPPTHLDGERMQALIAYLMALR
jgi:cytochrome c oxidase subunit II